MQPIRILHVLGMLNMYGAESRIMELYRNMNRDKVQFDFLVHLDKPSNAPITDETPGSYAEEIRSLGGRIYALPKFKVYNDLAYRSAVKKFFSEHTEFAMVQGHMTSTAAIYLPIAKEIYAAEGKELVTIAHARSAGVAKGLKGIATKMIRRDLCNRADYLFACSREAAEAVFGAKPLEGGSIRFIPNAIDTERFAYNPVARSEVRAELGIPAEDFVIGHVGRFSFMKNHEYLVKVFAEIYKTHPNCRLLMIGEGELAEVVKEQVSSTDYADRVIFAGKRKDVERYYQAMDAFVFPSIFEGLPGSVVEAACSGLPCYVSDLVTSEVRVTDAVSFLSINEEPKVWADAVLFGMDSERRSRQKEVEEAGFDVQEQVRVMTDFYEGKRTLSDRCYGGGADKEINRKEF